ncbi:MAG: ATP-binding protein [Sneathiella sp.]
MIQKKLFPEYNPSPIDIELIHHVAKTLLILNCMFLVVLLFTSVNPLLSAVLVTVAYAINVTASQISLKSRFPATNIALVLTLIPMFLISYLSGPDAAGWLLAYSGIMATHLVVQSVKFHKFLTTGFIVTASAGSYLTGYSVNQTLFVFVALLAFSMLLARLFSYRALRNDRVIEESARQQTSVDQLRSAIEALEDGFVIFDPSDRLLMCNEKYKELYERSRDLFVPGNTFRDIIRIGAERGQYPDAIGRIDEWVQERIQSHRAADTEVVQRLPDGKWLKISERKTPDGCTVGFRVDITLLKRAQEKAEAANLAKSHFLSTMSHEIRTPLNGVLGIAQLLTHTQLDGDQRGKVDIILSSGRTLLAIISDVLDMSRIEAGGVELENTPFRLKHLISEITPPFQNLSDEKNLLLTITSTVAADLTLVGDPVRLRQILWNLLSNAIKFTDQGTITFSIAEKKDLRKQAKQPDEHYLQLSIKDTGSGIAPDRVDAIFNAFTQEDSSITRKHGGTGLGLAIVKQLTELMGGTVSVDSTLGEGSIFIITIPFKAANEAQKKALLSSGASDNNHKIEALKILMAEDNEVNALIARSFLEKFGHEVRHVVNGKLAVEAAKDGWADLIFMDIHMPVMNGIEATKLIRATNSDKALPIIGLTAEAFTESHVEFINAGMNKVLTKPFTEKQLADTLATYIVKSSSHEEQNT